jgi:ketosteroid isomerase-like protein
MDRSNSYIKVSGDTAWVSYQWQFFGQVDGNPTNAFGHTTLVLQKRAGSWLIVLNHTSGVPATPAAAPAAAKPLPSAPQK